MGYGGWVLMREGVKTPSFETLQGMRNRGWQGPSIGMGDREWEMGNGEL